MNEENDFTIKARKHSHAARFNGSLQIPMAGTKHNAYGNVLKREGKTKRGHNMLVGQYQEVDFK